MAKKKNKKKNSKAVTATKVKDETNAAPIAKVEQLEPKSDEVSAEIARDSICAKDGDEDSEFLGDIDASGPSYSKDDQENDAKVR